MSEFDFDVITDANPPRRRPAPPQPAPKPATSVPERQQGG